MIGFGTARGIGRIACRRFSSLRFLPTSEWGPGGFFSPGRMEMAPGGSPFSTRPPMSALSRLSGARRCTEFLSCSIKVDNDE